MSQLLILRGYPSPSWLCSIGASYDVDPEFFRRHLAFLTTSSDDSNQDGASKMPSSSANMFHFRLPTIGSYTGPVHTRGAQTLGGLRDMMQASMNLCRHKLRIGAGWKTGDSIVRQYNVHDIDQFSIEQAVTVYFSRLRHSSEHWIVIIFMDAGADPGICEWPEARSTPRHLPFPHQKRSLALKPDLWKDEKEEASSACTSQWRTPSPLTQSASRLHIRYGRFLRPEMMCQDPFYTLNELFSILSVAEAQVLDVIERGFSRDSWQASQDDDLEDSTHSRHATQAQDNLVHARRMLEARISNLSSVLGFIERHQRSSDLHSSWPYCADARQQRECDAAAKALRLDFEHLQRCALTLSSRCESAMTLAMNRASIAEARRSLQQGQTISNFTALAFVFIPITATASIFGMNFQELGTGKLNIWLFFAGSAPLSFLCFMFLYGGWDKCWYAARKVYTENTVKATPLPKTHTKHPTHP
ncbi:hypothetical protein GJ744_011181 [Endocarpon pusillum]|uniref:Uncharacterized protein n=1 Tax=Endocarpon pusillum TaxID=364733 RepID=A0A8H7ACZ5_9EURO|nr:hypothetical protein GJ744_011181 [Endocarpon pusillum]